VEPFGDFFLFFIGKLLEKDAQVKAPTKIENTNNLVRKNISNRIPPFFFAPTKLLLFVVCKAFSSLVLTKLALHT